MWNLKIARSAQELTEAMQGVRTFRRLQQQQIDVQSYDGEPFLWIRLGRYGRESVKMVQRYERILTSHNPETLLENLELLGTTHEVVKLALFDQFLSTLPTGS